MIAGITTAGIHPTDPSVFVSRRTLSLQLLRTVWWIRPLKLCEVFNITTYFTGIWVTGNTECLRDGFLQQPDCSSAQITTHSFRLSTSAGNKFVYPVWPGRCSTEAVMCDFFFALGECFLKIYWILRHCTDHRSVKCKSQLMNSVAHDSPKLHTPASWFSQRLPAASYVSTAACRPFK